MHKKHTARFCFPFFRNIFFSGYSRCFTCMWLLGSRVRVSFRGYTPDQATDRPAHSLTDKKNLVLFFASPEFSFPQRSFPRRWGLGETLH